MRLKQKQKHCVCKHVVVVAHFTQAYKKAVYKLLLKASTKQLICF